MKLKVDNRQPDYFLMVLVGLLVLMGLIFLNSASSVMGYNNFKDSLYYLKHQLIVGVLPGILVFLIASKINLEKIKKSSNFLFFLGLMLLVIIFLPGISLQRGEAQRWINLGEFSFQPIEIFKLLFIFFLARFFARRQDNIKDFYITFLPFLLILLLSLLPIVFQKNLSAVIIVFLVALAMFWLASSNWLHLFGVFSLGLAGTALLIIKEPYRLSRILSFISPNEKIEGISYHIRQALIAIGSGGLFGLGLGYSRQKYFYLPESFGDSAFAVIAEELGFIFTSLLIFLFFLLVWRGLKIAKNSEDYFLRLVAVGISVWFGAQTIINIGGMLGVLPITGIPLPLISYGGSAMIANLAALGILVNISKQIEIS